jgi:hypothetical protein
MTSPTSGGISASRTTGKVEQELESIVFALALVDDQTLADSDQTLSDNEQTAARADLAAAESDQAAANMDQQASDLDLAQGGDPAVHQLTRELRDRSAEQRTLGVALRARAAGERDTTTSARDLRAVERDRVVSERGRELTVQD